MERKRLTKTIWYGSEVDDKGNPIIPSQNNDNPLDNLHKGELFLHLSDKEASLWTIGKNGEVVRISGDEISNIDLSDYLLKSIWNTVFEIKADNNGNQYLFGKLPIALQYGLTMYADGGNIDIPSIAQGLPYDNKTIWYNPNTNQIEVIGGTGGGGGEGGVSNFWDLNGIPSWITMTKPKYTYTEIEGTPDLSKYALVSQIPSLNGYATESWVLGKSYITSATLGTELGKYVTLDTDQSLKGKKDFKNGLSIDGLELRKSQDDVVYIDANLVVRGGVTMYAQNEVDIPSIIDSIPTASTTVKGIASFDGAYFSVVNGKVSLIASNVGLNEEELYNYLTSNNYAKKSDIPSLVGYATESWVNTRIDSLINGAPAAYDTLKEIADVLQGNVNSIGDIITALGTKWTQDNTKIANWDTAYSWGNHANAGYALKTYVDSELTKYVTISGEQTISGKKNFTTGGLFINGSQIIYDSTKKYWKLDGDLLVTGGITMYGDSVSGGSAGATTLGQLQNVGTWADSVATQDRIMYQPANSSQWVAKNLSDLSVGGVTGDYLPLSGGVLSGTLFIYPNGDAPLVLKSNGLDKDKACRIQFLDSSVTHQAYVMTGWGNLALLHRTKKGIGVGEGGIWCTDDNGTSKYEILHSNNYSNYTLPLTGGTLTGALELFSNDSNYGILRIGKVSQNGYNYSILHQPLTPGVNRYVALELFKHDGTLLGGLGINVDGVAYVSDKTANTHNIWHNGNFKPSDYLPLSGGELSGHLTLVNNKAIQTYDSNGSIIQLLKAYYNDIHLAPDANKSGFVTYINGDAIYFRYGSSATIGMAISSRGYVGIGTASPSYRFDVVGAMNATTIYQNGTTLANTYLSLSGGKMTGDINWGDKVSIGGLSGTHVTISTPSGQIKIGMMNTSYGHIYCDKPFYFNQSTLYANGHTIYHSGNTDTIKTGLGLGSNAYTSTAYLPSASYTASDILTKLKTVDGSGSGLDADLLDGYQSTDFLRDRGRTRTFDDVLSNAAYYTDTVTPVTGAYSYGTLISFRAYPTALQFYASDHLNISNGGLYVRCGWNAQETISSYQWRQIAFTTSNVASATKLQTARTIWGQSFDGTGNVDGQLIINNNVQSGYGDIIIYNKVGTNNGLAIGHKAEEYGMGFLKWKPTAANTSNNNNRISFDIFGHDNLLNILGNGNVGIGTTNPTRKLVISQNGAEGIELSPTHTNGSIISYNRSTSNYLPFTIQASYVGINTNSPSYKLDVLNSENNSYDFHVYNSSTKSSFYVGKQTLWYGSPLTDGSSILSINSGCTYDGGGGKQMFDLSADGVVNIYKCLKFVDGSNPGSNTGTARIGTFDRTEGGLVIQLGKYGSGSNAWKQNFCVVDNGWTTALFTVDRSGNVIATGGITMYSDQRKKTILGNVELSLKQIANAPLIEHYYNSDEKKTTHVGSIAQYWASMNDWFCKLDNEGYYTMEIQNAALASAISIARELDRYETKTDKTIKQLRKRICQLEEEVERLKSA